VIAPAAAISDAVDTRPQAASAEVKSIAGSSIHLPCLTNSDNFAQQQDRQVFWFKGTLIRLLKLSVNASLPFES